MHKKPKLKSASHLKAVKGMTIEERVAYSTKKAAKEKKRIANSIKKQIAAN